MNKAAEHIYNVPHWSEDYFAIDDDGQVAVRAQSNEIPLAKIIDEVKAQGLSLPTLIRFPNILHHRVKTLNGAFELAAQQHSFNGSFTAVYPIKVNQQRRVVEELVQGQLSAGQNLGLEAGSKPELMAVLAMSHGQQATIVCNGYKDSHYIRLALLGEKLGHKVYLVIEKLSELNRILAEAKALGVTPRLGVRARLASIGKGNWQNTGGDKSKFGLSASQILQVINSLKASGQIKSLQLLHFHLGSQIANIRDIQNGLRECGRFFSELGQLGAEVNVVDVGGGLGVDYEGTGSRNYCSTNYSMQEYANKVVHAFAEACEESGLPHPDIITESGRAMTAHHAVLVTDVIDWEQPAIQSIAEPSSTAPALLKDLWRIYEQLDHASPRSLLELYHDVVQDLSDGQSAFIHGSMTLEERAQVEAYATQICVRIRAGLDPANRAHREVFDELNERLADKLFVNFSLFQSVPDVWGIDQIFPILPLTGLNRTMDRRVVIQDITCDSDGRVDQYVDGEGIETTLPFPSYENPSDILLGFFMVGAYQEILGDMHNLFGDTDSVDVVIDEQGQFKLDNLQAGDSIASVLRYVNFDPEQMEAAYERHIRASGLDEKDKTLFLQELTESLSAYTYLQNS